MRYEELLRPTKRRAFRAANGARRRIGDDIGGVGVGGGMGDRTGRASAGPGCCRQEEARTVGEKRRRRLRRSVLVQRPGTLMRRLSYWS